MVAAGTLHVAPVVPSSCSITGIPVDDITAYSAVTVYYAIAVNIDPIIESSC